MPETTTRYNLSPMSILHLIFLRDQKARTITAAYKQLEIAIGGPDNSQVQAWSSAILALEATLARLDREIIDLRELSGT